MSDLGDSRRKQQLLDKFLAGEIDKSTYDSLLADLHQLKSAAGRDSSSDPISVVSSSPSFAVTESRTSGERAALSTPVALLEAGMELGGFQLKRRLRRGGMGEVWQAYDPTGERSVVIKVLPPELQRSPDEMARVKQTFNRVHNLQHEHICPVYLLGQDPQFGYFLVMKYLEGDTLATYRQLYARKHGEFPLSEVVRVLTQIAQALDYAHGRQIIHRDIKPQNIMLNPDGSDVQVVDFGLAAEVRTSVMRVSQVQMETCGTYPYMAPEQWRGEVQDARTDQYALAVMAFELLAGHLPFEAADPTVLRMCVLNDAIPAIAGLPEAVNAVIGRGTAKSRADRFDNCSSFVKALSAGGPIDDAILILDESSVLPKAVPRSSISPTAPVREERAKKPATSVSSPSKSNRPATVRAVSASDGATSSSKPGTSKPATSGRASSKPARRVPDDDIEILEPIDDELVEPDDDVKSPPKDRRPRPSVRKIRSEVTMERVNARAMFWVSLIGGSMCVSFMGLVCWLAWSGMHSFLGPTTPTADSGSTQIAANDGGSSASTTANAGASQPVVPPVAQPNDKRDQAPRYRWEHGKPYTYSVKVEMEPDADVVMAMSGQATYTPGQPVARKNDDPVPGKATGTGFVVHVTGYLVTCQHVVDNASEIEVAIGGKKYPAKVVLEDAEHDLAIIRIEANGLPALPLADSDKVQLGEEVRAIGFPFSSILGDNVKATRGTISGVNQEDDRKVFQVDAGINPGNSGGPLVNERGEVVGVNFAKMREEVATNVGFAVPINDAITLLRNEKVQFTVGKGQSAKLDGPELVKRVSAATALISVNMGGGAAAGLHHFELRCSGSLNSSLRSKSGKTVDPSAVRSHQHHMRTVAFSQPDVVETDPLGRVHDITGEHSQLPCLMGPMSAMVLEQLPSIRRPAWSHSFAVTIAMSEESGEALTPFSRFRPRFRPPGFPGLPGLPGGPQNPPKTTRIPAKVRVGYSLQETVGDLLKIRKDFDLEARDKAAGDPRIKLTGTGVWTFDVKAGIPRSLEYTATLVENEPNKSSKLPFKLSYQLVEAANIAQVPAVPVQAEPVVARPVDEPVAPVVPAQIAQKLTLAEVDQCLADLESKNAGRSNIAARKLQQAIPLEERRDEVLSALETMLKEKDPFRRKQAIDALGTWAKPQTIPLLIRSLDETALLVKLAAIDALATLKDERAAEPLAKLVAEPGPRGQAVKALQSLGAKAEKAVLALLTHTEPEVRQQACQILKVVGTAASLSALQTTSADADRAVAASAKEAAAAIAKRK